MSDDDIDADGGLAFDLDEAATILAVERALPAAALNPAQKRVWDYMVRRARRREQTFEAATARERARRV